MKESIPFELYNCSVAVYKGAKVAVHAVDKTEVSVSRQDLIELINVRNFYLCYGVVSFRVL